MSDERVQSEDQAILLALELQPLGPRAGAPDEALETLARLYTEALGMMPLALDPIAPSPDLRGRLLMTAAGDETQEVRRETLPGLVRSASDVRAMPGQKPPAPIPLPAVPPAAPRSAERPAPRARPAPDSMGASARPSRWPLRLAATLAVAALGLSGWLAWRVEEQSGELARLRTEARQAKEREAEMVRLREEVKGFESGVALVSSPSVLVCPLRPALGASAAPLGARAVLYVAADHQHWYFTARGLKESPAGQEYQLWFVADGRPVSGGTFGMKSGEPAQLSSATMPAGTTAVSITLERQGGAVIPTGPQVLLGDQMQQITS